MLDFTNDSEKLSKAKELLSALLPSLRQEFLATPLYLTIKGLQTYSK
jgi:hypothetical protein